MLKYTMDVLTKLAASFYLLKRADQTCIEKGQSTQVKKWDAIKGIPGSSGNQNYTDPWRPNPEDMPVDIGINNKQMVTGTGGGALIYGRYRNGDR
jgi:hypothetical protein